jgi:hypothetical protein
MPIRWRAFSAVAAVFVVSACGSSPAAPPPTVNTPPTIGTVTTSSQRAEAGQNLQVSATVTDAETPLAQLGYFWSALPQPGLFVGSGASVVWQVPSGQKTPDLYTLKLTVSESFTTAGQAKQNVVSNSTTVHYNDSPAEITFLSKDFLIDKFGVFSVTPAQAVSNFSDSTTVQPDGDTCNVQKAQELAQITENRMNFHILQTTYSVGSIDFNADKTFATVLGPCTFEDIPQLPDNPNYGQRERVSGTCVLTTVYENFQWRLCRSNFNGTSTTPESLRGRVPGPPSDRKWR